MPFLTLKRVIVNDGKGCPITHHFLLMQNARQFLAEEIARQKAQEVTFDENSSPDHWVGFAKDNRMVQVILTEDPFDDPYTRIYATELTLHSR